MEKNIEGYSIHRHTLDIHGARSQATICARKHDTLVRLYFTLSDGGKPYIIPEDCYATLWVRTPRSGFYDHCEINGSVIEYTFTEKTAADVGEANCELRLQRTVGDKSETITSPMFTLRVMPRVYEDGEVGEPEQLQSILDNIVQHEREAATAAQDAATDTANLVRDEFTTYTGLAFEAKKDAEGYAGKARDAADRAEAAASNTAESLRSEFSGAKETAEKAASNASKSAEDASGYADDAKTAKQTAVEAAQLASQSATNAAKDAAIALRTELNDVVSDANNAADRAEAAADKVEDATDISGKVNDLEESVDKKLAEVGYKKPTEGLAYYTSDGLTYVCTGRGTATDEDIVIASEIDGKPVTGVSNYAFLDDKVIKSLYLSDNTTHIGEYAFSNSSLAEFRIPKGARIGLIAFANTQIVNIVIPENVYIDEKGINACNLLDTIYISKSASLASRALESCPKCTVYTDATEEPPAWSVGWNTFNRPVIWDAGFSFPSVYNKIEKLNSGKVWEQIVDYTVAEGDVAPYMFTFDGFNITDIFAEIKYQTGTSGSVTMIVNVRNPRTPKYDRRVRVFHNHHRNNKRQDDRYGNRHRKLLCILSLVYARANRRIERRVE